MVIEKMERLEQEQEKKRLLQQNKHVTVADGEWGGGDQDSHAGDPRYGSLDPTLPTTDSYHYSANDESEEPTDENYQDIDTLHYSTYTNFDTASTSSHSENDGFREVSVCGGRYTMKLPSLRRIALRLSLWFNIIITLAKFVAYVQTFSLSVLAALLDAVLDVVSQVVLNYTEKHSSMQRSSAFYPAGASRLEPIGVLTCAALMGMASFEVLKESLVALIYHKSFVGSGGEGEEQPSLSSFWNMFSIVIAKVFLLWLCNVGANKKVVLAKDGNANNTHSKRSVQLADPTLEALAQDHFNDILSNGVAAIALLFALRSPALWFLDPVGAILISVYIIYSWYMTGKEQIEHLTGKVAPEDFIEELKELADCFDERMEVDVVRAYHFGPKFLVEIEVVMPKETLLFESHDVGMELQYEIEGREEVERCFVHIDYQTRPVRRSWFKLLWSLFPLVTL